MHAQGCERLTSLPHRWQNWQTRERYRHEVIKEIKRQEKLLAMAAKHRRSSFPKELVEADMESGESGEEIYVARRGSYEEPEGSDDGMIDIPYIEAIDVHLDPEDKPPRFPVFNPVPSDERLHEMVLAALADVEAALKTAQLNSGKRSLGAASEASASPLGAKVMSPLAAVGGGKRSSVESLGSAGSASEARLEMMPKRMGSTVKDKLAPNLKRQGSKDSMASAPKGKKP